MPDKRDRTKADKRLNLNVRLLTVCFTLFTFIVALNPVILQENLILAIQLTLAIPFFASALITEGKLSYTKHVPIWNKYHFIVFIIAYSMLINVIGILLSVFVLPLLAIIFFGANILLAVIYSLLQVSQNREKVHTRTYKDFAFITLIILFGLLPSIGIY